MTKTKFFDFESWTNVPDDSAFQFKLREGDAFLSKKARLLTKSPTGKVRERERTITGSRLNLSIKAGWEYQIRIWILFQNQEKKEVEARARIRRPNGGVLPNTFRGKEEGKAGEVWRFTFAIKG